MKLNYLLIIISILSVVNYTHQQPAAAARHSNIFLNCLKSVQPPVTLVIVKAAIVAKLDKATDSMKCFLNCWYGGKQFIVGNQVKSAEIINDFKNLQPTGDANGLAKAIEACKSKISGPATCQNVYDFHKCIIDPVTVSTAQS